MAKYNHAVDLVMKDVERVRVQYITFRKYLEIPYTYRTYSKNKLHNTSKSHE